MSKLKRSKNWLIFLSIIAHFLLYITYNIILLWSDYLLVTYIYANKIKTYSN